MKASSYKRLLIGLALVILLGAGSALAQVNSTVDTLRVLNAAGNAGQTAVVVSVSMRNTFPVGGFQFRLVYDSTLLSINPAQFVDPTPTHRAYPFFLDGLYGADVSTPGIVNFVGSWFAQQVEIPPGTGSIADLLFDVKPGAPDINVNLSLIDSPDLTFLNALSDTVGNLVLPVKTNGVFSIGDVEPPPGPGNNAPVIASISDQQVTEGELLTFQVSATDQDGDNITLSAVSLPPNATFPTVQGAGTAQGTFNFTPSSTQGPALISVTFRAVDDSGAVGLRTVNIEILDRPRNVLVVDSGNGGVAGKTEVLVPLILKSIENIYGFQFDLRYDSTVIRVDSLVPDPVVLQNFNMFHNIGDSAGFFRAVVFSLSADTIPQGEDTVLYLAVTIDTAAIPGAYLLDISNGKASKTTDPGAPPEDLDVFSGHFHVDAFGDMNLRPPVDIQDAIIMVGYLLGQYPLDPRRLDVADVNQDLSIDIVDLVGIINLILGRPIGAPTQAASVAKVELEHDQLSPGSSGEFRLNLESEVSVAGVQVSIEYNPAQIQFTEVKKTTRSNNMILTYRDNSQGLLKALLYTFGTSTIPAGQGSVLNLTGVVNPGVNPNDIRVNIKQVVLSDSAAVTIPTGDQPIVPTRFGLGQNFPNPFNANTTIKYEVPFGQGGGQVMTSLKVYNILGQKVRTLVDAPMFPGQYQIIWDGKDETGSQVASGMYFYRLKAGDFNESRKMTLLK